MAYTNCAQSMPFQETKMDAQKWATQGLLIRSLKWQKNGYTEVGHLRQELASHAAILAKSCNNWYHKWAIYRVFTGFALIFELLLKGHLHPISSQLPGTI